MRTLLAIFLGWTGLLAQTNLAFSQTASDLSKQISSSSNVPLATVVTDLVTKASSNSIISTLQPNTANNAQGTSTPSLDPQAQLQAIKKGYVVRDVKRGRYLFERYNGQQVPKQWSCPWLRFK